MSVAARSSTGLARMRATSRATLPAPITATLRACSVNWETSASGWPQYQATKSVAEKLPVEIFARDAEPAVDGCTVGEDDRVVVLVQVLHGQLPTDVDVAQEPHCRVLEHRGERQSDRLELGVVGRHAVPHEAERRRKAVEHVDAHVVAGAQRVGRVDPGGPGTDDRDAQHAAPLRACTPHGPRLRPSAPTQCRSSMALRGLPMTSVMATPLGRLRGSGRREVSPRRCSVRSRDRSPRPARHCPRAPRGSPRRTSR